MEESGGVTYSGGEVGRYASVVNIRFAPVVVAFEREGAAFRDRGEPCVRARAVASAIENRERKRDRE